MTSNTAFIYCFIYLLITVGLACVEAARPFAGVAFVAAIIFGMGGEILAKLEDRESSNAE